MAKKDTGAADAKTCPKCGKTVEAGASQCSCGHKLAGQSAASKRLAGLKQNLLAERALLEEKMQQLQRRLEAIQVLLEE